MKGKLNKRVFSGARDPARDPVRLGAVRKVDVLFYLLRLFGLDDDVEVVAREDRPGNLP
jgi:hypothetical protein